MYVSFCRVSSWAAQGEDSKTKDTIIGASESTFFHSYCLYRVLSLQLIWFTIQSIWYWLHTF